MWLSPGKFYTTKNKVSPQYTQAILTYVLGEGFSVYYDEFEMAVKRGVIQKKDDCYVFEDVKIKGDLNFYRKMKTSPGLFKAIQVAIVKRRSPHMALAGGSRKKG